MGKITKGKPITIRPSKKFNQKGNDGEYLDIESWRQKDNSNLGRINKNLNDYDGVETSFVEAKGLNDYEGVDKVYAKSTRTVSDGVDGSKYDPSKLENQLHSFASYNVIMTLSGLGEKEIRDHSFLGRPPHDIIARTGGIVDPNFSFGKHRISGEDRQSDQALNLKREKQLNDEGKFGYKHSVNLLKDGKDIFFENINILSTVGPNAERGLANFTKMEFELHEPFGVSLTEKIRAAAFVNGYENHIEAPLLLTMEFKGSDDQGKPVSSYGSGLVRKIPIIIARIEFDVDQGGTKYRCIAVPLPDLAHDDRFKFPNGQFSVTATDLTEWTTELSEAIKEIQEQEKKQGVRQLLDNFEFVVDPKIAELGKFRKQFSINYHESTKAWWKRFADRYIVGDRFKGDRNPHMANIEGTIGSNTSIVKFFEDAVRISQGFQTINDAFWLTYAYLISGRQEFNITTDKFAVNNAEAVYSDLKKYYLSQQFVEDAKKKQYIDWFEIKTSVETRTDEYDYIRKCHPKNIIYKAIPKKIHVLKFIRPGISLGNINWEKMVQKEYNYIYTGDNLDVQGMRINYKAAYYQRNIKPFDKDAKEEGTYRDFENNLTLAFTSHTLDEAGLPLMQEPSTIKSSGSVGPDSPKGQQFYDYLTNPDADMVNVELDILGDPIYICQDQFLPIKENRKTNTSGGTEVSRVFNSFNSEYAQPIIQLNFRMPDDINTDTGLSFEANRSREENIVFNGIYQLTKVDSRIDNGQFTQTLNLVRLNNQKGDRKTFKNFEFRDGKIVEQKNKKPDQNILNDEEFNSIVEDTVY